MPADLRLVQVSGCFIEMFAINGSPVPLQCTVHKTSDNPMQTRNLAFFGSTVLEGSAIGVVVFTGNHTILGRLANRMIHVQREARPALQRPH